MVAVPRFLEFEARTFGRFQPLPKLFSRRGHVGSL